MTSVFGDQWARELAGHRGWCCPRCGDERVVEEWKLRRSLTLFDRKLLSLKDPRRYLNCEECGRTYLSTVVEPAEERPNRPLSEDERVILAVVAKVIFSDSSVRAVEKRVALRVIQRYTGRELDAPGLDRVLKTARLRWRDPLPRLRRLACLLDGAAKRRIIAAAYLVSGADRQIHREESRLLMQMGEALDLAPREIRAAMQEATGA